ncbi:hypothetical protein BST45_11455 [Mycobacterium shinjukuense]|nr:hypothetical protein BST45_11455 [Mycobacterium shinjukuense]
MAGQVLGELLFSNSISLCKAMFQDPSGTSFWPVIARTFGAAWVLSEFEKALRFPAQLPDSWRVVCSSRVK